MKSKQCIWAHSPRQQLLGQPGLAESAHDTARAWQRAVGAYTARTACGHRAGARPAHAARRSTA
jgi:hypothetical protein